MALGGVAAAGFSFAGGLYGETFIIITPTPGLGGPAVHSGVPLGALIASTLN